MRVIYKKKSFLSILSLILFLTACGRKSEIQETTISVSAKGALTEEIVGSKDKQNYPLDELRAFAEDDIKRYNKKVKDGQVDLKSCEIKSGVPRIKITYGSWKDYADYHNSVFFYGTIEEAKKKGYDFDTKFVDNNGDTAASSTILANDANWYVVILNEPIRVKVSKDFIYVSENAKIIHTKEAGPREKKDQENGNITTDALVYLICK